MRGDAADFDRVVRDEVVEVVKRRQAAKCGTERYDNFELSDETSQQVRKGLVGLALSGGGVRAASFCLGVVQSFYRNGILKHVDYLSTVSGGGYLGSLLSSMIVRSRPNERIDWGCQAEKGNGFRLPLEPDDSGRQPEVVRKLIGHGPSLRQPVRFLSRHLWGLLVINAFALSGVIAVTAFAAYAYRLIDSQRAVYFLSELGFGTDVSRAFFPTVIMFLLWLIALAVSAMMRRAGRNPPQWPQFFYIALIVSIAMGVVGLMATGDVGLRKLQNVFGLPEHVSERIQSMLNFAAAGLLSVFGASLLPYLNVRALLNSGAQSSSVVKNWVFSAASNALVFGTPLVVFYVLAHENISNHMSTRQDPVTMSRSSIVDWAEFRQALDGRSDFGEELKSIANGPVHGRPESEFGANDQNSGNEPKKRLEEIVVSQDQIERADRETWFYQRWLSFAGYCLPSGRTNRFGDGMSMRSRYAKLRDDVAQNLSDQCLSNPGFHREFERALVAEQPSPTNVDPGSLEALFVGLERIATNDETRERWLSQAKSLEAEMCTALRVQSTTQQGHQPLIAASEVDPEASDGPGSCESTTALTYQDVLTALQRKRQQLKELEAQRRNEASDQQQNLSALLGKVQYELERLEGITRRIREVNWSLLSAAFPGHIKPHDTVFASVVNGKDQSWRLQVGVTAIAIFLLVGLINLNSTSLHAFYRDQLHTVWVHGQRRMPLHEVDTAARGGPIHILNGTLNLLSSNQDPDVENMDIYMFSHNSCGSHRTGYRRTRDYWRGKLSLADAMAISGAAVSPAIKTTLLFRLILVLTNFRLGRWVPTPASNPADVAWPAPLRVYSESALPAKQRGFCFVSDGGHLENTGAGSLLMRRCRTILAVDSSFDPELQFLDFSSLLRRTRWKHGVKITSVHALEDGGYRPIDLSAFTPCEQTGFSKAHCIVARIEYPPQLDEGVDDAEADSEVGYLIYMKPSLSGDEPTELLKYHEERSEFPHAPTLDQFFDAKRFECYRQLGEHVGDAAVALLQESRDPDCDDWLSNWQPYSPDKAPSDDGAAEALSREELLRADNITASVAKQLIESLADPDSDYRVRIIGRFGHPGDQAKLEVRHSLADALMARHPHEDDPECVLALEKALQSVGGRMPKVREFFKQQEAEQQEAEQQHPDELEPADKPADKDD